MVTFNNNNKQGLKCLLSNISACTDSSTRFLTHYIISAYKKMTNKTGFTDTRRKNNYFHSKINPFSKTSVSTNLARR